ncbi:hypothetical protein A8H39_09920 [Paraburkholderia fungorum]|uniref:hypothetical protein n=1 Tax=Paraburkholderia fungorum TaxID=134537 RepID=UPI0004869663|nr:hypothetical protein [Paraburkholderia fungorum]MBB5543533.1 hypothetical protein [Paraburkholderia fungorum]PNE56142.1 hypothetical protein A8H39_09920 [Paraburkholderia fungorum]
MTIDKKDGGLPPRENPSLDIPSSAGFASLGGLGAAIDAEAAAALNPEMSAAAPGAQADMGPDYHKGACGIVDLARGMIGGYAPGAEWDEPTSARMAASLTPVFEKYGWDVEGAFPCELVALMVCGPVLYQSARAVALKIKQDRFALEHAQRGMTDPNTVKGAAAAESGPPAGAAGIGDITAADTLAGAAESLPVYPPM